MKTPFRYHYYNDHTDEARSGGHSNATAGSAEDPIMLPGRVSVESGAPVAGGRAPYAADEERKMMYDFRKDMDFLRAQGARKGIVDAGLTSVGASTYNRRLWALKVGKGSAHKVLFTGCHHAREWISLEIPYLVAEYLIENYTDTPRTDKQKRIKHLLLNRQIWFVPLVNPDGHVYTTMVNRNWRPNRKEYEFPDADPSLTGVPPGTYTGVDINRNYATPDWGVDTYQDTYQGPILRTSRSPWIEGTGLNRGTKAGEESIWCGLGASNTPKGEKESAAIDALIRRERFRASITYHSFGKTLLRPDAVAETASNGNLRINDPFTYWVGEGMNRLIGGYTYESGSQFYRTTGDLLEFSYMQVPGRPTFLPEVQPARREDAWPAGTGFTGLPDVSPLPNDPDHPDIASTFRENLPAALALINCAGHNRPPVAQSINLSTGSRSSPRRAQVVRNCWEVFLNWTP